MANPVPFPPKEPAVRIARAAIFVRDLRVDAQIGIYGHEYGRTQPLVCEVEITFRADGFEHIADTIDYDTVVQKAKTIAAGGHMKLVETYCERLALACLEDPRALAVRVRVEKPEALGPHSAMAGVELVLERP